MTEHTSNNNDTTKSPWVKDNEKIPTAIRHKITMMAQHTGITIEKLNKKYWKIYKTDHDVKKADDKFKHQKTIAILIKKITPRTVAVISDNETVQQEKIRLSDISHRLINKKIIVSILPQIISEKRAIPTILTFECKKCKNIFDVDILPEEYLQSGIKLCTKSECIKCGEKAVKSYFTKYKNCYVIQGIQPLSDMKINGTDSSKDKIKIIDETRSTKPIKVYYITDENENVPFGVLKAEGLLTVDTRKTPLRYFLVVDKITSEKDYFLNYKITDKDKADFKTFFTDNNNLDDDISNTIAPNIIGRDLPKFFTSLSQHSVLYIKNNILGTLSVLFLGDSRCGKSEIILDTIYNLSPIGSEYMTAESATRTGVSYTLKQVGDTWEIEWGILPLCDKMIVGLDGLHAWKEEEVMQLREARSQGFIRVRRAVKADSPARVRVLGSANTPDPITRYPTHWHATWDNTILNHVDRNRWDFLFVFGESDINKTDINERHRKYREGEIKRAIPVDIWKKHIIWTWQLTPDRIIMCKNTYKKIESIVNKLHAEFSNSKEKPFTNEFFNTFEKATVACAALEHSVDDNDNLLVKPQHVERIYDKIEEHMQHLELNKLKHLDESISFDQFEFLLHQIQDTNKQKILLFIGNNRRCQQIDIVNYLKVSKPYISNELDWFQENKLIDCRTKISLNDNGAALYRKLLDRINKKQQEKIKKVNLTNYLNEGGTEKNKNNVEKIKGGPVFNEKVRLTHHMEKQQKAKKQQVEDDKALSTDV